MAWTRRIDDRNKIASVFWFAGMEIEQPWYLAARPHVDMQTYSRILNPPGSDLEPLLALYPQTPNLKD
jgi:hypothetical protein